MNIGFVTTWLERGATHVTRIYMELLKDNNNLYVFGRGGEYFDESLVFPDALIEKGYRLYNTSINWKQFRKWIDENKLDVILFNEQDEMECVYLTKIHFPEIRIGCYIDYYKENTVHTFGVFDFLLCNTKRHYKVFNWHKNSFYIPWGTDIDLFRRNIDCRQEGDVVFFHSAGMSNRKGTHTLVSAFVKGSFSKYNAKLIIHTQKPLDEAIMKMVTSDTNIQIITRTVPHPGLYYLGDVYVYPTTLDGLGLTIYEALASGLPVITTNAAPMNEIISPEKKNGRLVDVEKICSRSDGYYWPLSYVSEDSLIKEMMFYISNRGELLRFKQDALRYAEENLDIKKNKRLVNDIVCGDCKTQIEESNISQLIRLNKQSKRKLFWHYMADYVFPPLVNHWIRGYKERKRFDGEN